MTPERFKQLSQWVFDNEKYTSLSVPVQNIIKELFNEVAALQWCKEHNCAIEYWYDAQVLLCAPINLENDDWTQVEAENLIQAVEKVKEQLKEY